MADESEIQEAASDAGKTSGQVIGASEAGGGKKYNLIDDLFSGGNKLLTLPGSSLVINDDTRRLLALFADGRFLVVAIILSFLSTISPRIPAISRSLS